MSNLSPSPQRLTSTAPQVLPYGYAMHRLSQRPRYISGRGVSAHPMVAILQDIAVGVRIRRIDTAHGINQALSVPEDLQ